MKCRNEVFNFGVCDNCVWRILVLLNILMFDVVEAHCYVVDIGRTDREQIRSRINNNWCRTFRPRRPLSTAYKTTWLKRLACISY